MPNNDREVFDKLAGSDEDVLIGEWLAYAVFAFDRRQWMRHHEDRTGQSPSVEQIDGWIANISDHQFDQMRGRAVAFFRDAAREYMEEEVVQARDDALQDGILREVRGATEVQKSGLAATLAEVRSAGSFWKQLGLQLLTAILAPILIGSAFALTLVAADKFPSPKQVAAWFYSPPPTPP